jgi:glutaredoxin
MVKEFLSQRGVSFQERTVDQNQAYAQEMVNITGQTGVPVTVINGQPVIGFDRSRLEYYLAQTQTARRPTFGAFVADAGKIPGKNTAGITSGAYVGRVRPNSVAEKMGLVPGDIITMFDLKQITNTADLELSLSAMKQGSHFSLSFLREGKALTAEGTF